MWGNTVQQAVLQVFIYPFLCGTNHNSLSVVVSYFRERKEKQPLEQIYRLPTEIHINGNYYS